MHSSVFLVLQGSARVPRSSTLPSRIKTFVDVWAKDGDRGHLLYRVITLNGDD